MLLIAQCSHIRIQSPNADVEQFRNRKGYFSLNVQAICSSNLVITNLVARQVISYNMNSLVLISMELYEHTFLIIL